MGEELHEDLRGKHTLKDRIKGALGGRGRRQKDRGERARGDAEEADADVPREDEPAQA